MSEKLKAAVERITKALDDVPDEHQDAVADALVSNIAVMAMTIRAVEARK